MARLFSKPRPRVLFDNDHWQLLKSRKEIEESRRLKRQAAPLSLRWPGVIHLALACGLWLSLLAVVAGVLTSAALCGRSDYQGAERAFLCALWASGVFACCVLAKVVLNITHPKL